jgi:hypothetical protein
MTNYTYDTPIYFPLDDTAFFVFVMLDETGRD